LIARHAQHHPVAAGLAIAGASFFLLAGYEFVRSASKSLYIDAFGAAQLPLVMALSPVGTLLLVYAYGALLSRLGSRRTLFATTVLSGLGLALCYVALRAGAGLAAGVLYVLREAYIVVIIEQYWSFINSTLNEEQARRYNGPICGLASIGSILGSLTVGHLAEEIGTEPFVLLAALFALPAAAMGLLAYRLGGEPVPEQTEPATTGHLGLSLFRQHPRLVLLFLVVAATQIIGLVLELSFSQLLEAAMPEMDARTAFLGYFWASVNGSAYLLQFVVAPLLLPRLSLRLLHAGIPVLHMLAAALLFVHPTLGVGAFAFLVFKSVDYSLFRAGKEILYIPLPFDARYRAKEVIDAFGYRASKGGAAGIVAGISQLAASPLPVALFPVTAIVTAAVWLGLVPRLTRGTTRSRSRVQ